jgi:hypothetical protein
MLSVILYGVRDLEPFQTTRVVATIIGILSVSSVWIVFFALDRSIKDTSLAYKFSTRASQKDAASEGLQTVIKTVPGDDANKMNQLKVKTTVRATIKI